MVQCNFQMSENLEAASETTDDEISKAFRTLSQSACDNLLASSAFQDSRFANLDVTVNVLFGTEEDILNHGSPDDALGIFYVAAYDPIDDAYDIPDEFLCIVNVPAHLQHIHADDADTASIEAAAVTAPHEVVHALQFALAFDGKTPLEVFDTDETAFFRFIKKDGDNTHTEDEAEEMARVAATGLDTSNLEKMKLSSPR